MRLPSGLRFLAKRRTGARYSGGTDRRPDPVLQPLCAYALFLVLAGLLWWWHAANAELLVLGRAVIQLASASIAVPADGTAVQVGFAELGQPAGGDNAEARHLEFFAAPVGAQTNDRGLFVRNRADRKRAFVRLGDRRAFLEWWWLRPDGEHRISLPGASLVFSNVGSEGFDLAVRDAQSPSPRRYQVRLGKFGVDLRRVGDAANTERVMCRPFDSRSLRSALGFAAHQYVPALAGEGLKVLDLIGAGDCFDPVTPQVGLRVTAVGHEFWRDLVVLRRDGRFYLSPGENTQRNRLDIAFAFQPATPAAGAARDVTASATGFSGIAWRLDGPERMTAITVGRTRYDVRLGTGADRYRVNLVPAEKIPLFDASLCEGSADERCPKIADRTDVTQEWRPPFRLLSRVGADVLNVGNEGARESWLTSREQRLRTGVAIGILAIAFLISGAGGRFFSWIRNRHRGTGNIGSFSNSEGSAASSVMLTAVVVAITLAPEISLMAKRSLSAELSYDALILAWGMVGAVMMFSRAALMLLGFWIAFTALAAVGSTTLMMMATDGASTHWASYAVKHKYLFLDLVPPLVVAAVTLPLATLRPLLHETIVNVRPNYRFMRWLAAVLVIGPFLAWAVAGGQLGIGGFQPVEAGKFAAAVIIATFLAGLGRAVRRTALRRGTASRVVSFVLLCALLGLLMAIPVFRNDYSPALIVGVLVGALLGFWMIPALFEAAATAVAHRIAYRRIPLGFWPRRFGWWRIALPAAACIALPAALLLSPAAFPFAIKTLLKVPNWPAERLERIAALQEGLGVGRRVPVERFLAYEDLRLDTVRTMAPECIANGRSRAAKPAGQVASNPEECPRARFRDIEFQQIRSRVAIGHAPCAITGPLAGAYRTLPRAVRTALEAPIASMHRLLVGPGGQSELCQPLFEAGSEAAPNERAAERGLLNPRAPISIPVVQTDFTAAYMIARFGVGTGFVFALAQGLVLVLGFTVLTRLQMDERGGLPGDSGVRTFLSVTLAGVIVLFALHWVISWSNALSLLPVMGQPMSWLSAATSHHLLMVLPCLVIIVLGARFANYRPGRIRWRAPPTR